MSLFCLLLLIGCDMPAGAQLSPSSDVEILDGGAHYDGDQGWVRFRYRT